MSMNAQPFGGGGGTVADATETTAGKIRIATSAEAATGTSDVIAMTPLTVKEVVDASKVDVFEYKGTFNATAGTPSIANAEQGDVYVIDTAGTIYGQDWNIGDHLLINADMGGSITNSKIDKVDNTDSDASETVKGIIEIATNAEAGAGTATDKALVPSNVSSLSITSGQVAGLATVATSGAYSDLSGTPTLGTAAALDVGTSASQVVQLDGSAKLPAVDGSQLTNLPSASDASETVKGVIEIATNAEAGAGTATDKALVPSNVSSLAIASGQVSGLGTAAAANTGDFLASTAGLDDLSDVSFTAGAGIDNYVLTYDHSSTSWGAEAVPSAPVTSVNSNTGAVVISGNDVVADHSATHYTAANPQVDGHFSGVDTALGNKQPLDAGLTSISGLTTAADKMIYTTGSDTYAVADLTSAGRALLDDADAAAQRTTLGLGTAATSASTDFLASTAGLDDLSDVSFTAGAGIDNYVLTYDHSTTSWGAEAAASGGISAVVDDTTPQLGGALDTNGQSITSASNADVTIDPNGTGNIIVGADLATSSNANLALAPNGTGYVEVKGNTNPGAIRLNCESNSHGVTIQSPAHSANATYTLTLPDNDGNADQVLKTDGSGVLSWVDQSSGGATAIGDLSDVTSASYVDGEVFKYDSGTSKFVSTTQSKIKRVSSATHTLTSAEVADGIYVIYTGSAIEFDLTLPDPNSLTENNTVDGSATKVVEVRVGRDIAGDIRVFGHANNTVYLLGDVAANATTRRTVHSSHFITVLGFASSNTGYWITADGDKQIDDFVNINSGSNVNLYGGEFVNLKTGISSGFTCTIRGSGQEARKIVVNNDSNITVSIVGFVGTPTSINGTSPGSFSLEAGKRIELYCDTDANPDDWITVNPEQGAATQLSDLSDVDITGATTGEVLRYDGSEFVDAQLASTDLSDSGDLARLASPALSGTPTAPTATTGTNTTQIATTAFVTTAVAGGGASYTYSAITNADSPVTAVAWYHYSVNTSGGAITINLPALNSPTTDGDEIRNKLRDATNAVTIDANSTETIDGSQTFTLDVAYSAVTLVAGSTEWEIV